MRRKIGECLIKAGLITDDDLQNALNERRRTGERLGVVLVRMNLATEEQIAKALALQLGFPYVDLTENAPDRDAVVLIPKEVALKRACVAIGREKNLLTVAMADPLLFSVVQDLELQTGYRVKQVVTTQGGITDAIATCYPDEAPAIQSGEGGSFEPVDDVNERSDEALVRDLVDRLLRSAIRSKASDIHVEPTDVGVLVRHRLDGRLKDVMRLPRGVHEGLVARLKVIAGMDAAEQRLPQDGRLRTAADEGVDVDFRVSTARTLFGEKLVMRVLDRPKVVQSLEELGMSTTALEEARGFLRHQHGLILVAGPTGSGKSATLSSFLRSLQSERTSIVTIEDPIEYQIAGVNHMEVDDAIGLTFASVLQSILRQDTDVVLLGKIPDSGVAQIAVQAAQTGRLILSALHADDATAAVTRLIDIGSEPFMTASGLIGVVAQRLVRRLCAYCRRQHTPSDNVLRALDIADDEAATMLFFTAVGCDQCNHTGYRGRVGIFEVLRVTNTLRRLIAARATGEQLRDAALAGGMVTLGEDGLAKVKSGVTTPEELMRVVADVREMRTLCSSCGSVVSVDFNACPHCGKRISAGCSHCGRALQPGWNFCPYCMRSTSERRVIRPLRGRDRRDSRGESPPAPNVAEFKK
jgi:type IV pilus assembly protein PilB